MGKIGEKEAQRRALREGKAGISAASKTSPRNEPPRSKTVSVGSEEVSPSLREIPATAKEGGPASRVANAVGADPSAVKFDRASYQRSYMREYMRKRRAARGQVMKINETLFRASYPEDTSEEKIQRDLALIRRAMGVYSIEEGRHEDEPIVRGKPAG